MLNAIKTSVLSVLLATGCFNDGVEIGSGGGDDPATAGFNEVVTPEEEYGAGNVSDIGGTFGSLASDLSVLSSDLNSVGVSLAIAGEAVQLDVQNCASTGETLAGAVNGYKFLLAEGLCTVPAVDCDAFPSEGYVVCSSSQIGSGAPSSPSVPLPDGGGGEEPSPQPEPEPEPEPPVTPPVPDDQPDEPPVVPEPPSTASLVLEAEDQSAADWVYSSNINGHTGPGYLQYVGPNRFGNQGGGVLNYDFTVTKAGSYQLLIRNYLGCPPSRTECNDVWMQFDSGRPVQGEYNAGSDYIKVYSNTRDRWNTATKTVDHVGRRITRWFPEGVHRVRVSGRSNKFIIDQLKLVPITGRPDAGSSGSGGGSSTPTGDGLTQGPGNYTGRTPQRGWKDSYMDRHTKRCYIDSNFDHGIGGKKVDTPFGRKTIREVAKILGKGPGAAGNPIFNDVQCGNGPANNAGDEDQNQCPGRVDLGKKGCYIRGPKWFFDQSSGGSNQVGRFDKDTDLLALHYDHAPDKDDIHATAAGKMVVDKYGIDPLVVIGAYGKNASRYNNKAIPTTEAAYGNNYLDAHKRRNFAVSNAADEWLSVLRSGGSVFVAEGGQSDFTADVLRAVRSSISNVKARVTVVQHSKWNEDQTTGSDLSYVKKYATYKKIEDGNRTNSTADLHIEGGDKGNTWRKLRDGKFGNIWTKAFAALNPQSDKLDFSDTVELLYILGIGKGQVATPADFESKYN